MFGKDRKKGTVHALGDSLGTVPILLRRISRIERFFIHGPQTPAVGNYRLRRRMFGKDRKKGTVHALGDSLGTVPVLLRRISRIERFFIHGPQAPAVGNYRLRRRMFGKDRKKGTVHALGDSLGTVPVLLRRISRIERFFIHGPQAPAVGNSRGQSLFGFALLAQR